MEHFVQEQEIATDQKTLPSKKLKMLESAIKDFTLEELALAHKVLDLKEEDIKKAENDLNYIGQFLTNNNIDISALKVFIKRNGNEPSNVKAKYRYTDEQGITTTWSGRGKTPKIFLKLLDDGHVIDEFLINKN